MNRSEEYMFYQKNCCRLFFVLFLALGLNACNGTMGPRHEPSDFNVPLAGKDFGNYIDEARTQIKNTTRGKLETKWIEARLPFEKNPGADCSKNKSSGTNANSRKQGVLLIHGLSDSPFLMRDLGNEFVKECFLVRSILLPGHGTVPGDLVNVRYGEWVEAAEEGINSFDSEGVDDLYLVGFSTGASLSLHHVLSNDNPKILKGLILMAPGVREKTRVGFIANWHKIYSWLFPRGKWLDVLPDEDKVKYESFPKNAGDQFHLLTQKVRNLDGTIKIPVYMAISSVDATVEPDIARGFFCDKNKLSNTKNRMVWYYNPETNEQDPADSCLGFKPTPISKNIEGVLNYAHVSIPVASENDYYGKNQKYKNCLAYTFKADKLAECKLNIEKNSKVKFGEKTDKNNGHPVRRLTFNPGFDEMVTDIFDFIDSLD